MELEVKSKKGEDKKVVEIPEKIVNDFVDDTANLKQRFTSRKLIFTAITFIIGTYFVWVGIIQPDHWIELIKWISVVYFGANVGDKFSRVLKDKFKQVKNTF